MSNVPQSPLSRAAINVWPDLGQMLGLSRNTAYALVNSGKVRSLRVGRRILVPLTAVDEYLNREADEVN